MNNKTLNDLFRAFNLISGMEITLTDAKLISSIASKKRGDNFCSIIHSTPGGLEICRACDRERIEEAKSTCKPNRYTCPFGIEELIYPIVNENSIDGYIFCSMGINKGSYNEENILNNSILKCPALPKEDLRRELVKVPRYTSEQVAAYADLISLLAEEIKRRGIVSCESVSLGTLAKNYIKENITKDITLSDISYYLHCSTVTLTQHFKAEFGITIMQYVMQRRLKIAEELLRTGDESVKKVAMLTGFVESEYFAKCFKKHYGKTPTEYRKDCKTQRLSKH